MIKSLYAPFKFWSSHGTIWIYSDTHFEDTDCKLMDSNWITPEEQIKILNSKAGRNDTLILLGDVGNPEWIKKLRAEQKILILGNHDAGATKYRHYYFDEVYEGPLMISEKIILSHEPIYGLDWCLNIHGHDHSRGGRLDKLHYNVCSNTVNYQPLNLDQFIKRGGLADIPSIHRLTIDNAKENPIHG